MSINMHSSQKAIHLLHSKSNIIRRKQLPTHHQQTRPPRRHITDQPPITEQIPVKTISTPYRVPYPHLSDCSTAPTLSNATPEGPVNTYPTPLAPLNSPYTIPV